MRLIFRDCAYCDKPSSFICKNHKSCQKRYSDGRELIISEVLNTIKNSDNFDRLENSIIKICASHMVPLHDKKNIVMEGWEQAVEKALDDEIPNTLEERRLGELIKHFSLSHDDLDNHGWLTKYSRLAILREVQKGNVPDIKITGNVPINLQKNEKIVWAFENSEYLEDRTQKRYVGGSQGISVRVMKGVYYRTSAFRGHTVSP